LNLDHDEVNLSRFENEMLVFLITGIFGDLPIPVLIENGTTFYKWAITNKYYSASIYLCTTTHEAIVDEEFIERVDASIVYFNSSNVVICSLIL